MSDHPNATEQPPTSVIRKGLDLLTAREKKRGVLVLLLVVAMALVEATSVVSILPFLSVVSDPDVIERNRVFRAIFDFLGEPPLDWFIFYLGLTTFSITLMSASMRAVTQLAINRFTQMRLRSISTTLIETYLRQPYEFFLNRHSGEMSTRILSEAVEAVDSFYKPGINVASSMVTILAIVTVLFLLDPVISGISLIIFGGAYAAIYLGSHDFLKRRGGQRTAANKLRFATAANIFAGIKTLKVAGAERAFLKEFDKNSLIVARSRAATQTLSQVPRFAVEAVAFGGIILICLVVIARGGGMDSNAVANLLPVLGLYGVAGYRLIPAFQQLFAAAASLRAAQAAIESIYVDMFRRDELPKMPNHTELPLPLLDELVFDNTSYQYPNAPKPSIDALSLTIPVGARIGVVGSSGAGKSTMVDLLLGLLKPTTGRILVDGKELDDGTVHSWQRNVGYVPQEIFLLDASIMENVAFKFAGLRINEAQVVNCLRAVNLYDFVMNEMPDGLHTLIGERGVRMSGGQRQRLGIARALYTDPAMLILDEATSALDNVTELEVMKAVNDLTRSKTVVMVAHRLSSLRDCETILFLKNGRLVAKAPYETLLQENEDFRALAELA